MSYLNPTAMCRSIKIQTIISILCLLVFCNSCTKDLPVVSTANITDVTATSAKSGGSVTDNGGSEVTERGVCWGIDPNPEVSVRKTTNGSGNGSFESTLSGLAADTKYFVRAFAINSEGISYGNEVTFTTDPLTVTDIDGNVYSTVIIGLQIWMKENLKTTKYFNGSNIPLVTSGTEWASLTTPAFCWADNNEYIYKNLYGGLYNWYTVNTGNLCPEGWHVPSDNEWKILEMLLGMSQAMADLTGYRGTNEGSMLKSGNGWYENGNGTNLTGFSALPSGWRDYGGEFYFIGNWTDFWTSTEINYNIAYSRALGYKYATIGRYEDSKKFGFSIRCIKNN